MDKTKRVPVSEDPVDGFSQMVVILATQMGMMKIPGISRFVELLLQECDRYSYEIRNGISPQKKIVQDSKQFIVIFKTRHLQCMDLEYDQKINGVDVNMIKQLCRALAEKDFTVDEFLKWFFDCYLVDNPKLCPPNIKLACSSLALQKFVYENRHTMQERAQRKKQEIEGLAWVGRGRILIRKGKEKKDRNFVEKAKKILLEYSNGSTIDDLKTGIEEMEKEASGWAKMEQEAENG